VSQGYEVVGKYFASSQANINLLVQKCQENEDFVYKPSNKPSDKTDYRRELETKKGLKNLNHTWISSSTLNVVFLVLSAQDPRSTQRSSTGMNTSKKVAKS
jgi:hypothetical protein